MRRQKFGARYGPLFHSEVLIYFIDAMYSASAIARVIVAKAIAERTIASRESTALPVICVMYARPLLPGMGK